MLDSGLANITMFFVIIGICLIFVITWILKSEARINICKDEIKKLKGDLDSSERERFVLTEKTANLEAAGPSGGQGKDTMELEGRLNDALAKNNALKDENKKLKKELAEATTSLEEVYKALSESK
jgi:chromosome segregation ATPase